MPKALGLFVSVTKNKLAMTTLLAHVFPNASCLHVKHSSLYAVYMNTRQSSVVEKGVRGLCDQHNISALSVGGKGLHNFHLI